MAKEVVLRVILDGISRATAQLNELAASEKRVLQDLKDIEGKRGLITERSNLKRELSEIRAEMREYEKQSRNIKLVTESENGSVRQLAAQLAILKNNYKELGTQASKTKDGIDVSKAIRATTKELDQQTRAFNINKLTISDYRGGINALSTNLFSVFGQNSKIAKAGLTGVVTGGVSAASGLSSLAFLEVARGIGTATSEIVKFNAKVADAQADVARTANLSIGQVQELTDKLKGLDTRTAIIDLLKIGEVLGKLGVETTPQVIAAMDKLNVALNTEFGSDTEKIVETVGKLKNLFTEFNGTKPEEAYLKIGNALVTLANSGASSAPIISEFSKRIAGTVGSFGLSAGQILGVSATLEELGTTAYRGASGFSRVISEITKQPEAFSSALKITDERVKQFTGSTLSFTELVNKDLYGAFTLVLNRIKEMNLSVTDQAQVFDALKINGQSETEVLNKLQVAQDLLAKRVGIGTQALTEQSTIIDAFTKKNQNLAGELQQLGNNLQEAFISSGLQHWLTTIIGYTNEWFVSSKKMSETLGQEQTTIYGVAASILALNDNRKEQIQRINEVKAAYPPFFDNIRTEKAETALLLTDITNLTVNRDEQLKAIARLNNQHPEYVKSLKEDSSASSVLVRQILDLNTNNDERNKLIGQLKAEYPDFFAKLEKEKDLTDALKASIDSVNTAYARRKEAALIEEAVQGDTVQKLNNTKKEADRIAKQFYESVGKLTVKFNVVPSKDNAKTVQDITNAALAQQRSKSGVATDNRLPSEIKDLKALFGVYTDLQNGVIAGESALNKAKENSSKQIEAKFSDEVSYTRNLLEVLKNSLSDYDKFEKEFIASKASNNFKAQTEAIQKIKQLDENVKTLVSANAVSLVKGIQQPSRAIADLVTNLNAAEEATKIVSKRVLQLSKGNPTTEGDSPDAATLAGLNKKAKTKNTAEIKLPSDNAFDNSIRAAELKAGEYKRKYEDILDKLNRDIEEASAKGEEEQLAKKLLLARNSTKDRVAAVKDEVESVILAYEEENRKYLRAIELGEEHLKALKSSKSTSPEKQKEINETVKYLKQLNDTRKSLEDDFHKEELILLERRNTEIALLDKALKVKIAEIQNSFFEKQNKEFIDKVRTAELTQINSISDEANKALSAIEDKRNKDNEDIFNSQLSNKKKKVALLKADRENDILEAQIREKRLNDELNAQKDTLNKLYGRQGVSVLLPSLTKPLDDKVIEEQKKKIESTEKEITQVRKSEAEKRTAILRSSLDKERTFWEDYGKYIKDAIEQVTEAFLNTELELERQRVQANYDLRVSLLEKEFAYKSELYKNDADNLKRIEQNKADEKAKLDKQYAEEQREIAIKQAEIDAAGAIIKVFFSVPFPASLIAAAAVAATTALQIKAMRTKKFSGGGHTGFANGERDETGHRPVGIVHEDEYVVPTRILRHPRGRRLVDELEYMRVGSSYRTNHTGLYAQGGFTALPNAKQFYYVAPTETVLSKDSINLLTNQVYIAILKGTEEGLYNAQTSTDRLKERKQLASSQSTV